MATKKKIPVPEGMKLIFRRYRKDLKSNQMLEASMYKKYSSQRFFGVLDSGGSATLSSIFLIVYLRALRRSRGRRC